MKTAFWFTRGVAGLLLALAACSRPAAPVPAEALPTTTVRARPVEADTRAGREEVVGTVRARLRAVIEAKVSGRIEQMRVVAGQSVRAGDPLAELDAREVRARLDQATATRDQADSDLGRFRTLLAQDAVTRAEFDAVQARQRIAHAAVQEAETLLGHTRITAPFGGVITRKLADQGDLASPGRPLLEIEDPRQLRLEINVPEALIARLQLGTRVPVRLAAVDGDLEATVAELAPSADPNSRTFLAQLDLPVADGIRAGQFGRALLPLGERTVLRVPAAAVVTRGQLELVFVVRANRAELRLVKTGRSAGDHVEIVSGLDPNEVVVVAGAAGLQDGQPVQPQP
jgi:RND family efflux transporter MFP subunit